MAANDAFRPDGRHAVPDQRGRTARCRCRQAPGRSILRTPDGATLHGIHIPPAKEAKPCLLVLGFGGNAWNGSDVAVFLHRLYPDAHVVAFHYRGYRPSTGKPSAAALLGDAPLVRSFAVKEVQPDNIVAAGFSIGSGIAASLARDGLVDGADPGHPVRTP